LALCLDKSKAITMGMMASATTRQSGWDVPDDFNFATDVVDAWARPENDKEALIWENASGEARRYRFSHFSIASNRLANVLEAQGIGEGDRVLTILPRVPEWQIAVLAILKVGAIAVPVPDLLQAHDVLYRLKDSGAKAAIAHPATAGKVDAIRADCPELRIVIATEPWRGPTGSAIPSFGELIDGQPATYEARRRPADTPAIMYYSSGTTGYPKGILHAQRALFCWRTQACVNLTRAESSRARGAHRPSDVGQQSDPQSDHLHARVRGGRRPAELGQQTDPRKLVEPPGRRCGCWVTSPFLFREFLFADSGSGRRWSSGGRGDR
jgi:acyl-CoA synthetase (AMP-forming)/AMP-acid ligase II